MFAIERSDFKLRFAAEREPPEPHLTAPHATGTEIVLTGIPVSDTLTNMRVTSRDFQRNFAQMKAKAAAGETLHIISEGETFLFKAVKPRTWQGALKGKARVRGDLFSTGLRWENSE